MKFMGDYPSKQTHSSVEVTDQIFVAAIQEEVLRDEIYCQIMKQLTENRNRYLAGYTHPASADPGLKYSWWSGTPATLVMGWGQRGRMPKCWSDTFPSPFFQAVLWGLPLRSTQDHWLAVRGHRAGLLLISLELLLCSHQHSMLMSVQYCARQARCYWSPLTPKAVCGENMALHRILACFQSLLCPPFLLGFPMTIFPSYKHIFHTRSFTTSEYLWVVILIMLHNCLAEQVGYTGPCPCISLQNRLVFSSPLIKW